MPDPTDELFALPPESFTAQRDVVAKALRAAGDKAGAAAVRGLRRPTVAAWALNQVVRRHLDEIDALIAAGQALREAQRGALAGDRATFRAATRERRDRLAALRDRAAVILDEAGVATAAHLDDLARALEAATADPDVGEAVRAGRLSRLPEGPAGFGLLGMMPDAADEDGPAVPATPLEAAGPADADPARREAEAAVEEAHRALAERRAEQERAAETAGTAREAADVARAGADSLHRQADEAEAAARSAEQAAEEAGAVLAAADAAVGAADRALAKATGELGGGR